AWRAVMSRGAFSIPTLIPHGESHGLQRRSHRPRHPPDARQLLAHALRHRPRLLGALRRAPSRDRSLGPLRPLSPVPHRHDPLAAEGARLVLRGGVMPRPKGKRGESVTKGERTREVMLEAALKLFRRRGFDETTMRDIAEATNMSLGASYYYFESKE